jgi:hypothetical protein
MYWLTVNLATMTPSPNSHIQSYDAVYIKKNSVMPVFSDAKAGCNFQSTLCLQCTSPLD